MPESSSDRIDTLEPGERLLVMKDCQNEHDQLAVALRTSDKFEKDRYLVGYCPRYLREDVIKLMERYGDDAVRVFVERVNPQPAPSQFRLMCRIEASGVAGFQPFSSEDYEPIGLEREHRRVSH